MGKQYTCSYCGKILYSSQYVKKHEATHTGQKFKAATCKYCGKTVEYTKVNLQFHLTSWNIVYLPGVYTEGLNINPIPIDVLMFRAKTMPINMRKQQEVPIWQPL